ncbi:MAG: dehydrogenase [Peptococcaceae bacterium BRH_c23]|nr:MAG: dehydrogenase [Peptococcaceae bacterium BRH_c23]
MMNRRSFLKWTGAGAAAATLGTAGLFQLRPVKADELESLKNQGVDVKYTADVMCPSECGLEMWVKDGRLTKIYGNKAVPFNDGTCCAKGASGVQLVYSPDRIKYPMIREGERGEGKFRKATWDEAIDYIGNKLTKIKKEHGPESVIMDAGDVTDRDQYWRLFFAFGTPNVVEHGAICDTPRRHGPKLMFGGKRVEPDVMRPVFVRQPDGTLKKDMTYKNKLIIYVGWNPFVATRINYESRGTLAAKVDNGCKIIVVDPALTNTGSQADLWLPIRPGTDGELFAGMLRYILENDNPNSIDRRYIDWDFKKYSEGWDEYLEAFKAWWTKIDPITNLPYFSLEWCAARTGIEKEQIIELSHMYGSTKPAALVCGMQSPGHHYNGYVASILMATLNVITGNFDVPGGVVDTEITKSDKGGSATGKDFKKKKIMRTVNGVEVEGDVEQLHMDLFGDWPVAWDDVVGDFPKLFMEGVSLKYGAFKGHKYPIKAFLQRTGNAVVTGSAPYRWQEALTAKEPSGEYKVELMVTIDTIYLESALYADVILPEASYAERMSLSDIYPPHPMIYLRDEVIKPLHESKPPTEIMNLIAKKLYELGDKDIQPKDFWEKYKSQEDFVNEMLKPSPGKYNVGQPLPYPKLPEGYKLIGTPDSLEAGRVTIDNEKKEIKGEAVTVEWLRKNKGVAVWPMSWYRYRKFDATSMDYVANKAFPNTKTKLIEFKFNLYSAIDQKIQAGLDLPRGMKEIGWDRLPSTFYWFETTWNPHTNPKYKKYAEEFPFQLIVGRVHQAMSGTQMIPWLAQTPCEGIYMPLNNAFEHEILEANPAKKEGFELKNKKFKANTWCVGTVLMHSQDAAKLGLKTGDMIEIENPLKRSVKSKVYVSEGIRPGVVKMGFGTGGRFSPGLGGTYKHKDYTPSHNMLVDPDSLSPLMGMPAYADMIVKIKKI